MANVKNVTRKPAGKQAKSAPKRKSAPKSKPSKAEQMHHIFLHSIEPISKQFTKDIILLKKPVEQLKTKLAQARSKVNKAKQDATKASKAAPSKHTHALVAKTNKALDACNKQLATIESELISAQLTLTTLKGTQQKFNALTKVIHEFNRNWGKSLPHSTTSSSPNRQAESEQQHQAIPMRPPIGYPTILSKAPATSATSASKRAAAHPNKEAETQNHDIESEEFETVV